MKMNSLIIFINVLFSSCQFNSETNVNKNIYIKTKMEESPKDSLLINPKKNNPQLVLNISNKDFFKNDEILQLFNEGEQYKLGNYVPLDFKVGKNSFYIPNRTENVIRNYSMNGKLLNMVKFSPVISPDVFEITSKGMIISNFLKDTIYEVDTLGNILTTRHSSDLRFSYFKNNFLIFSKNRFYDKLGYFKVGYEFNYYSSMYDFFLFEDNSFCLVYFDEDKSTGIIEIIKEDILSKKKEIEINIAWDDFNSLNILSIHNNKCVIVLSSGINDYNNDILIEYNLITGNSVTHKLNLGYTEKAYIGEAASVWSSGVIYKYDYLSKSIYTLLTSKDNILIFKHSLMFDF